MSERTTPSPAGRIGVTLLCVYLLGVTFRIGGCYFPESAARDQFAERGPKVGEPFPEVLLQDVQGGTLRRSDLLGRPTVLLFVPSLDWSAPTKARLLDLAEAAATRPDVRFAVVMTDDQANARSATFVRDHALPFTYLVDASGVTEALGLATSAPDGTSASQPATFVLDPAGVVRWRDTRDRPRTWPSATTVLGALPPVT